jgi:hypothetical protein
LTVPHRDALFSARRSFLPGNCRVPAVTAAWVSQSQKEETLRNPIELADRYVAVWNEALPEVRRAAVRDLWAEDGVHVLQPPDEIAKIAARPGIGVTAVLQARGHAELTARVDSAHTEFVASGQMSFRRRGEVSHVHDVVRFSWEAVSSVDGSISGWGTDFLVLDVDGRIRADYQFVEA